MKICTITCQNADNHGARLQCYALVRYLQKKGHEVEVIDYRPDYMRGPEPVLYWPGLSLKKWAKLFLHFHVRLRNKKRHAVFESFSKKYLPRTRVYWNIEDLRNAPPEADLYLAGSDQIWNTTFRNGTDPGYYLDFGAKGVRRESFAASFATEELASEAVDFVKSNLKRFDKITMREQSALKILEKLGFEGELQDDPVFLLSPEEWSEIADGTGLGEKYVLVYDFFCDKNIESVAKEYAQKNDCKIFAICHKPLKYASKNFVYAGPESFVSLVKNAKYVVSNSFHGTVLAMIYNVPFKVVERPDGLNVRMRDLLERRKDMII